MTTSKPVLEVSNLSARYGKVGALANRFYKAITDIQYGRAEGPQGWIVPVA